MSIEMEEMGVHRSEKITDLCDVAVLSPVERLLGFEEEYSGDETPNERIEEYLKNNSKEFKSWQHFGTFGYPPNDFPSREIQKTKMSLSNTRKARRGIEDLESTIGLGGAHSRMHDVIAVKSASGAWVYYSIETTDICEDSIVIAEGKEDAGIGEKVRKNVSVRKYGHGLQYHYTEKLPPMLEGK